MLAFWNAKADEGKLINLLHAFAKYSPDACAYLEPLEKSQKEDKQ